MAEGKEEGRRNGADDTHTLTFFNEESLHRGDVLVLKCKSRLGVRIVVPYGFENSAVLTQRHFEESFAA